MSEESKKDQPKDKVYEAEVIKDDSYHGKNHIHDKAEKLKAEAQGDLL